MNKISIFFLITALSLSHGMHGAQKGTGKTQNPPEKSVRQPINTKPLDELLQQHKKAAEDAANAAKGNTDEQSEEVKAAKQAQQTYEQWQSWNKAFQEQTARYAKVETKLKKEKDRPNIHIGHTLFPSTPTSTKESANNMLNAHAREHDAQAALFQEQTKKIIYENSWSKEIKDQVTIANTHLVYPLVVKAVEPVVTEVRQKLIHTTASEKRTAQIEKDAEEISKWDVKLKKQSFEHGEATKKHNEEIKDMEMQKGIIEQFVAMGGRTNTDPQSKQIKEMVAALMESQTKKLYKKETGKDFVPKENTNKPEQAA
jgi:hypothetical protein